MLTKKEEAKAAKDLWDSYAVAEGKPADWTAALEE